MIRSGIAPLDDRLGGLLPRRTYVVTGAPGTGKSIAALEFLNVALDAGETAVLLTHDDPSDLLAQGKYLGIELEQAVAEERLILLRYQLDFARKFSRAPSPEIAFDELRRLVGGHLPSRIAVDSLTPLLEGSTASGAGITALLQFLERLGATSLVTYPADLAGLYDRRLEPLMQRAAAIMHFDMQRDRTGYIEIRKVRYEVPSIAPIPFVIQAGSGITAFAPRAHQRRAEDGKAAQPDNTKLLILELGGPLPAELHRSLATRYEVSTRTGVSSAFSDLATQAAGAVLVVVNRDTVGDALTLVRQLRHGGNRAPIALVTPYNLRSEDRARALRAGADEFLSGDMRPDEFVLRVEGTARRGRAPAVSMSPEYDSPAVVQPRDGDRFEPLDDHAFRNGVQAHLINDKSPFFTLLTLKPQRGAPRELASLLLEVIRTEGGDLAGTLGARAAVYLHSARRKDVEPFVARVRDEWRSRGHGELEIDIAAYPAEEGRIDAIVGIAKRVSGPATAARAELADRAPTRESDEKGRTRGALIDFSVVQPRSSGATDQA